MNKMTMNELTAVLEGMGKELYYDITGLRMTESDRGLNKQYMTTLYGELTIWVGGEVTKAELSTSMSIGDAERLLSGKSDLVTEAFDKEIDEVVAATYNSIIAAAQAGQ